MLRIHIYQDAERLEPRPAFRPRLAILLVLAFSTANILATRGLIKLACFYPAMILAGREAFAPQDLPALFVTLDLVSYPGGWLFSSGG